MACSIVRFPMYPVAEVVIQATGNALTKAPPGTGPALPGTAGVEVLLDSVTC